jgi:hypothetical protein
MVDLHHQWVGGHVFIVEKPALQVYAVLHEETGARYSVYSNYSPWRLMHHGKQLTLAQESKRLGAYTLRYCLQLAISEANRLGFSITSLSPL